MATQNQSLWLQVTAALSLAAMHRKDAARSRPGYKSYYADIKIAKDMIRHAAMACRMLHYAGMGVP